MSPPDCIACHGSWPAPHLRIADCGLTTAYLHEDQFFEGWTVLLLKRHATELFLLTEEERGRLIEEVSAVGEVLSKRYRAIKINYELLGNQLPHIHWHLIPRHPDDPAPLEPVWRVAHQPV
jgi:diadenosine tetraphosphate (Ap4A) HIT family hydrolase